MSEESQLSPLNSPPSLEKLAYDTIKKAILTFRIRPGETLVESDLARQLGISKTPVRESMSRLEKEGFIVKIPYKGYTAAPISAQEIVEIFQVRASLEGTAASLAAPRLSTADLANLTELVQQHEMALANNDNESAASANRQFHQFIIQKAGNQRLSQILANLEDHLQRYRLLAAYQAGRPQKSAAEHRQVLTAFQQHAAQAAAAAISPHRGMAPPPRARESGLAPSQARSFLPSNPPQDTTHHE